MIVHDDKQGDENGHIHHKVSQRHGHHHLARSLEKHYESARCWCPRRTICPGGEGGTAWMKTKEPSQVDSGDSTKNNNDGDVPQV